MISAKGIPKFHPIYTGISGNQNFKKLYRIHAVVDLPSVPVTA
jgi:hypothetical protein